MNHTNDGAQQTPDALARIVEMAKQLTQATANVARLNEELEAAKKLQRQIETEHLPELMKELGVTSVSLADGLLVELKEEFDCGITKANHAAALKWLDDNNFGSIIKTKVQVEFARDDRQNAVALSKDVQRFIVARRIDTGCEMIETIHPQTLKSFLKEQMKAGMPVPYNLFSIHPYNKAKLSAR